MYRTPVTYSLSLGATALGNGRWQFLVWAPNRDRVELHLLSPRERIIILDPQDRGYHCTVVEDLDAGAEYLYRLDGDHERPDPASRFQPHGVHGPSQTVDPGAFNWNDEGWPGLSLEDYVFYEFHVGTYTREGTLDAVIPHLGELVDLGVTALEIMPVAQFPGDRNWGYDGAYPFSVQNTYGGPGALRRLVDAAHGRGLALVLDVVYNHLGPEGNYLGEYAPYFTDRYHTPWGAAINFDGAGSDEVRRFFIENALYWLQEFHIDALRLDAIHGIVDASAFPFLAELGLAVQSVAKSTQRKLYLMAESDLNDARVVASRDQGGYGLDAQWSDDFHHALHVLLTGEKAGYYADFDGVGSLATSIEKGWCFSGQYSKFRQRRHGNSPRGLPRHKFVVCSQNHDQVGNRALGDRLSRQIDLEGLKLAAGTTLLSPFLPLLFMGEEYGETAPFQYFTSHTDADLMEGVRRGRREEFAAFGWGEEIPDPQAQATFERSKLNHELKRRQPHASLLAFYKELIKCRSTHLPIEHLRVEATAIEPRTALVLRCRSNREESLILLNFGKVESVLTTTCSAGTWQKLLDSADRKWRGSGSSLPCKLESGGEVTVTLQPTSFAVFAHDNVPHDNVPVEPE